MTNDWTWYSRMSRGNVIPDPNHVGNTGRYLQVLIQTNLGFVDESPTGLAINP